MMDIEAFRDYCLGKKGVTETFPFDEVTLVFKVMGKMFAITSLKRIPYAANLKCDPERAIALRETYDGAIIPAWHMNKVHWNSCVLEELPPAVVYTLIDDSYSLVVSKLTKKLQAQLAAL